jgi:hypothetical protein
VTHNHIFYLNHVLFKKNREKCKYFMSKVKRKKSNLFWLNLEFKCLQGSKTNFIFHKFEFSSKFFALLSKTIKNNRPTNVIIVSACRKYRHFDSLCIGSSQRNVKIFTNYSQNVLIISICPTAKSN